MLGILLTFVLATPAASPEPQQTPPAACQVAAASAQQMPLTKLRKLHLVRPDLIPYPVATETYC